MIPVEIVFWASLLLVGYVYLGYPALLYLWSRLREHPVARRPQEPAVSLVMAVHNERATIAAKLDNLRALDYPRDKLQIVVALDAPTDGTDEVVATAAHGVEVLHGRHRQGKAVALNRAVQAARGDVLVFCDARQRIAPSALRELVRHLADPAVGAVTGELLLLDDDGRESADGVGLYWRYEKSLRAMESRIHSTVGATGALYAIRRELFAPIPEHTILDDVIVPMRAVLAGFRSVYAPGAKAYDRVLPPEREFPRKVRTLAGNFQLLALVPGLLDPRRNPVFVQFLSHKVGRLLVPYLLLLLLAANCFLRDGFYLIFLFAQGSWYLLAACGALARRRPAPHPLRALLSKGGRSS